MVVYLDVGAVINCNPPPDECYVTSAAPRRKASLFLSSRREGIGRLINLAATPRKIYMTSYGVFYTAF